MQIFIIKPRTAGFFTPTPERRSVLGAHGIRSSFGVGVYFSGVHSLHLHLQQRQDLQLPLRHKRIFKYRRIAPTITNIQGPNSINL